MVLILKYLCTYDIDTEVFGKLIQKYGILEHWFSIKYT